MSDIKPKQDNKKQKQDNQNVAPKEDVKAVKISSLLRSYYYETVVPKMMKDMGYKNKHQVPKITKVVLSMGLGDRDVPKNVSDLTAIAGQKAVITKAKKSVSQFSVRVGHNNGAKVTLRNQIMFNFLHRFRDVALLSLRTFPGFFERSINNMGKNLTISLGIKDKRIFHEVRDDSMHSEGLNVTIVTNCREKKEVRALLENMQLPFGG